MEVTGVIKLAELVRVLKIPYREASYVLEQRFVPPGISSSPSTGNHRLFSPGQAFWLGLVLGLKRGGIQVPLAAQFADRIEQGCRGICQVSNWDSLFQPWLGKFETEFEHYAEIGDTEWLRLVTSSNPSKQTERETPELDASPWSGLNRRPPADPTFRPLITIRLDLSYLADQLRNAHWQEVSI